MKTLKKIEARPEVDYITAQETFNDQRKIKLYQTEKSMTKTYYIVELRWGYCWRREGTHTFSGDTVKEVQNYMREVKECECEECQKYPRGSRVQYEDWKPEGWEE